MSNQRRQKLEFRLTCFVFSDPLRPNLFDSWMEMRLRRQLGGWVDGLQLWIEAVW